MGNPTPPEEELRELSCEIAQEVFKDILPEAYDNFDVIKRSCFEPSFDDVLFGPTLEWLKWGSEILLIIHAAIEAPRVARDIWEWWQSLKDQSKSPKRSQIVFASNPDPPLDKLCEILGDKLGEAEVDDETIGKILHSVQGFFKSRRRSITIGRANLEVYDLTSARRNLRTRDKHTQRRRKNARRRR